MQKVGCVKTNLLQKIDQPFAGDSSASLGMTGRKGGSEEARKRGSEEGRRGDREEARQGGSEEARKGDREEGR
jgi:hypothetical protein